MIKAMLPLVVIMTIFSFVVACERADTGGVNKTTSQKVPKNVPILQRAQGIDPAKIEGGESRLSRELPPPKSTNIGSGTPVEVLLQDVGGIGKYQFSPADFTFDAGETVTFTLSSETEYHTFTIDSLNVDIEVDANTTEHLTYTFKDPGTYEITCIPHGGANGMTGTITVN